MAEVLQHSATAQFAGIPGAGAGDVDRRLAECALPFELQFADKAGRRACQGDPAGVACGHDLDNRAALLPIPMRSSKGRGGTSVCEPATVRFCPTATIPTRPSLSPKLLGPITPRYTLCRTGTKYRAGQTSSRLSADRHVNTYYRQLSRGLRISLPRESIGRYTSSDLAVTLRRAAEPLGIDKASVTKNACRPVVRSVRQRRLSLTPDGC